MEKQEQAIAPSADLPISEAKGDTLYIHAATSDNTRQAYQRDIQDFLKKGGALPATPERVEEYLRACASHYNPRTLKRRITALRQWHKLKGYEDPTTSPLVTKTLRGISRLHGKPKQQAAALRLKDLDQIVAHLKEQPSLSTIRNCALILVGFFGAFRRSELIALTWEQVQFVSDGMIITLNRSKTDQVGEGAQCIIPFGNKQRCPVQALIDWRQASGQWEGAIFRRLIKGGKVSDHAINPLSWNQLIKQIAKGGLATYSEKSAIIFDHKWGLYEQC